MNNARPIRTLHPGLALAPLAALLLVACASTPANNAALDEARSVYSRAAGDADTARSAPLDLRSAQQALQQAESALTAGEDTRTVEHYAYLARQRAATALQSGEIARAEQSVAAAGAERNRILIAARGAEAEQARLQAQREREQAEQARIQAEQSRAQTAQARTQAEQARAQAEQARLQADQQRASAQAAQANLAKLQQEMAELQAKQTDRGMVLTLGDVLFDTARAELKPGAFGTLDRLATFMRDNPERSLEIEGHTDAVGSDALNLALSQRRAESVRAALVSRGVDGARISTKGLGKTVAVASNDTAEGRQRNRRVEIVISNTR